MTSAGSAERIALPCPDACKLMTVLVSTTSVDKFSSLPAKEDVAFSIFQLGLVNNLAQPEPTDLEKLGQLAIRHAVPLPSKMRHQGRPMSDSPAGIALRWISSAARRVGQEWVGRGCTRCLP